MRVLPSCSSPRIAAEDLDYHAGLVADGIGDPGDTGPTAETAVRGRLAVSTLPSPPAGTGAGNTRKVERLKFATLIEALDAASYATPVPS